MSVNRKHGLGHKGTLISSTAQTPLPNLYPVVLQDHLLAHPRHQGHKKPLFRRGTTNSPAVQYQVGTDSLQQVLLQRHSGRDHHSIPTGCKQYRGRGNTTLQAAESHRTELQGSIMDFLSQKMLQLFEQEHTHSHPGQSSGSACCCQELLTHMATTHLDRLNSQPLAGALCPLMLRYTHTLPCCRGIQSRECAGIRA